MQSVEMHSSTHFRPFSHCPLALMGCRHFKQCKICTNVFNELENTWKYNTQLMICCSTVLATYQFLPFRMYIREKAIVFSESNN